MSNVRGIMAERNYQDEQVKGLERYIPTLLSKSLLGMMLISPWLAFPFFHSNSEWFLTLSIPLQKMLLAILSSSFVALVLALSLILNLLVIIYQSKHKEFVHYNTIHPLMSWQWLIDHFQSIHWLSLCLICTICFALGYYVSP